MAKKLTEQKCMQYGIDFVVSPDCYRELPQVIKDANDSSSLQMCVKSLNTECYEDIYPDCKYEKNPNSSISITRGCNNMCSYCIVPFTKGKERSRRATTIIEEYERLVSQEGTRQITLLGQNVNSYCDDSDPNKLVKFPELLEILARRNADIRIRFMSPHPKDFPLELLHVISKYDNICNYVHLPLQSGSNSVLKRMLRRYTIESYMKLVDTIRSIIPNVGLTTDVIAGFCGETEEEFNDTLKAFRTIKFDYVTLILIIGLHICLFHERAYTRTQSNER
jgi:tRNA-2-methylthio-N6-dimethylallyladenosine synthase